MAESNTGFLEFFMASNDAGLNDVARRIFNFLDPVDLQNLMSFGKKNHTFKQFFNKEKKILFSKFEI